MANANTKDLARMRSMVAAGLSLDEMAAQSRWGPKKVERVRLALQEEEERRLIGRRTEETFVEYVVRTRQHIRELEEVRDEFLKSKQGSALVGAIKAKQDLMDRIIDRGQEFGFIAKRPERRESMLLIANLTDAQLLAKLREENEELRAMMVADGGGRHILEVDTEIDTSPRTLQAPATYKPARISRKARGDVSQPPPAPKIVRVKGKRSAAKPASKVKKALKRRAGGRG